MTAEGAARVDAAKILEVARSRLPHHPHCLFTHDPASDRLVLGADDETVLEALVEDLRSRVSLLVGALTISHRETIARAVDITFTANEGAPRRVATIRLAMAPGPAPCFVSQVDARTVGSDVVAAVGAGVAEALTVGIGWSDHVVGTVATLVEVVGHDGPATAAMFRSAGRDACRRGLSDAGTVRLAPVMRVRIAAPITAAEAIRRDLLARHARIDATDAGDVGVVVEARVPLAALLGYRAELHRLSRGSGIVAMTLHAFEPVGAPEPPHFPGAAALRA